MKAEEIQTRLSQNLKELRKQRKMTQFELAEKAEISEAMVKSIELSHSWPSEKTLSQLSKALNIDVLNFFMPTSKTVEISEHIKEALEETLRKSFQNTVNEITSHVLNEL